MTEFSLAWNETAIVTTAISTSDLDMDPFSKFSLQKENDLRKNRAYRPNKSETAHCHVFFSAFMPNQLQVLHLTLLKTSSSPLGGNLPTQEFVTAPLPSTRIKVGVP